MPIIHVDCCALTDKELSSLCAFLSDHDFVTNIVLQTEWLNNEEEEDDQEPMILNIDVSESHWQSIIAGSSNPLESAAKWLIKLLEVWGEKQRDMIVGYDDTQNIVVIGNPDDWK